ncbi:hypothetical protein J4Q44_G00385440 [Coregonus suidteri]|uniref:Uncharacterized protein n=1 Tax=Coregonus suidteri TaxID=861788 RepID=A0AAN8KQZ9_9TELE
MSGAIHPTFAVCLALCLAGWAVSGASVKAQKTSPVCYLCNDKKCQTVESVYDHFKDHFTLWSRGKMAEIPPCNTTSPLPSGECLVCVDNQKIYAVCDSEIIKPVFEGQDNSMPAIEANCTSIFSTDGTGGSGGLASLPDPNAPTLTPDGTGGLSKEVNITIGVLAPMAFLVILFIIVALCRRTRSMSTSEVL